MLLLHICEKRQGGARGRRPSGFCTFATMDEETAAFPDLSDFEFFVIILQNPSAKLKLPGKFAKLLDGREPREVQLRVAGDGRRSLWDVEVVFDGDGQMHLGRGWEQFASVHGLQLGHFLAFTYDGDAVLTVKVFDGSMCHRHYQHDDDDASSESNSESGGTNSIESGSNNSSSDSEEMDIDDAPSAQFTVTLRQCNLGIKQNQYLNLPLEFLTAHGYADKRKVVLRMRGGRSWPVTVKRTGQPDESIRMSLKYGWHQFCVDNRLGVGDTCFFRALRGNGSDGEDYALKVEVLRRDGTFGD
ncbi:unnamed protein product [Alopecurus aequalis]